MAGTMKPTVPVPGQNLINQARSVNFTRPPGFWKSIVLDLLSVFSALFLGYSYLQYLARGFSPWYLFGAFLAFSACSALQVLLTKGAMRLTLVIFSEAVALVVCFVFYTDLQIVFIAGVVAFLALLWGYFASRLEAQNELEIRFFKVTRNVLGKVMTAVLLVMIIVYVPQAQGDRIFVSRENFKVFFDWTAGLLNPFYPSIPFTGSFGNFSESFAKAGLADNPSFKALTVAQQNTALEQAAAELSGTVARATGITPTQNDQVSDVAYDYTIASLMNMKNKFSTQFIIIWIILLFLTLRVVGIVFVWIAECASLVVYEILILAGFMRIEGIPQTKEQVVY